MGLLGPQGLAGAAIIESSDWLGFCSYEVGLIDNNINLLCLNRRLQDWTDSKSET